MTIINLLPMPHKLARRRVRVASIAADRGITYEIARSSGGVAQELGRPIDALLVRQIHFGVRWVTAQRSRQLLFGLRQELGPLIDLIIKTSDAAGAAAD
jgi:hypothetical protein